MWNLIKAQNYQLKNDLFCVIVLLIAYVPVNLYVILSTKDKLNMKGSDYLIAAVGAFMMLLLFVILLLTARICSWDFMDKTINYEILSGHSRTAVFGARVLSGLFWAGIVPLLALVLPLLMFTALNGWGYTVYFDQAMLRLGLLLLAVIRLVCEMVLLAIVIKNCYAAMFFGYVLVDVGLIISLILDEEFTKNTSLLFAGGTIIKLFSFENYSMKFIDGKQVQVYQDAFSTGEIAVVVAASVLVSVLCLFLARNYFRKQDMS